MSVVLTPARSLISGKASRHAAFGPLKYAPMDHPRLPSKADQGAGFPARFDDKAKNRTRFLDQSPVRFWLG